jgi:TIR domain
MPGIFLSYRADDSADLAARIRDRLRARFGKTAVSFESDSIPFGADVTQCIPAAVEECDLLLALIGHNWVGAAAGARAIDDPRDWVRIAIEAALKCEVPVLPVLIDGATIPGEACLRSRGRSCISTPSRCIRDATFTLTSTG